MATLKVKVSILIFVLIMCSMLGFVGIIIQGGEHLIEVGNVECFSQKQLNTRNILMNDTEPPVADAGENMIVNEDTIFILDGSNSTDDIGIVNFTWTGWTIVGEDSGRAIPECIGTWYGESVEVVVNEPDTYKFLVKVMDIGNNSNEDWINVTVRDITPPIVQFGFTDWSIDQHETFSYKFPNPDVDGEWWCQDNVGVVNYTWTMECIEWYGNRPDSIVSHNESFECILDDVGKYRFIVNVSDAAGNTDNDFTLGRVKDVDLPIADAGEDIVAYMNETVTFDASNSTDNVGIVEYSWLIDNNSRGPDYIYGRVLNWTFGFASNYTVYLTVYDAERNSGSDNISVVILPIQSEENQIGSKVTYPTDFDGDGWNNSIENYTGTDWKNPDDYPSDIDIDGIPDALDNDIDGDGWNNTIEIDVGTDAHDNTSFPEDLDDDGIPDALDDDIDGDGWNNTIEVKVGTDSFDTLSIPSDLDNDTIPDLLDPDLDGDGVNNTDDAFPYDSSLWDSITDPPEHDFDADDDGFNDTYENASGSDPFNPLSTPFDLDGDGWNNTIETQVGSNLRNNLSVPPDIDGDGITDTLDLDRDGDGIPNDKDDHPDEPFNIGIEEREEIDVSWWTYIIIILMGVLLIVAILVFMRNIQNMNREKDIKGRLLGDELGGIEDKKEKDEESE